VPLRTILANRVLCYKSRLADLALSKSQEGKHTGFPTKIPTLRREERPRKEGHPAKSFLLAGRSPATIEAARSPHRTVSVSTDDQDISRF
jgi:hypothetical protein